MKTRNLHPLIFYPVLTLVSASALSACSRSAADLGWNASSQALGPIPAATEFSIEALSARTGDLLFSRDFRTAEGESYTVIVGTHVLQDGILVFTEDPANGQIGGVDITLPGVIANGRGDIGDTFADTGLSPDECYTGIEERMGQFVCFSEDQGYLGYWFFPEGYRGPDSTLPPADVMARAVLYEIRWAPGF